MFQISGSPTVKPLLLLNSLSQISHLRGFCLDLLKLAMIVDVQATKKSIINLYKLLLGFWECFLGLSSAENKYLET